MLVPRHFVGSKEIQSFMLIINVKDSENIDRALKRYKRKFQNAGIMKELRRRKEYLKPSIRRRAELLKAAYRLKMQEKHGVK